MNTTTEISSSAVRQIRLIAAVEVRRLLSQTKGLMTLAAYVLLWLLLLLFVIRDAVNMMQQPQAYDMVMGLFGDGAFSNLFKWPVAEYAVYWVFAIMLHPMFATMLSAGQFADDIQRGTFRFLSLHCSRTSLFFGRFAGALLVMALLTAATVLITMVMALVRAPQLASDAVLGGLLMWLVIMAIILPYIALMSLLSVIAANSKQAIIYAVLYFTLLTIVIWAANMLFTPLTNLNYLLPGAFSEDFYRSTPAQAIQHLLLPLGQSVLFLGLGYYAFRRSDV
ncbi:ABC transporter permease subunit [Shewanella avicenniae]|uniref:ABC transporter permease subunit n=1 Tax=Shewanella avicenniae TaxID=2814294 RepID=A0ABX7QKV7_9GAMM|nr:ABC transporter permease subunit [Shewanella avicenniae]QSX32084.1 ABC transporter permease subunit [Shewanella avicenniae]